MFKKAVKEETKLRLAIAGPSGSGKTYSALSVGTALGRAAVLDTEHGSASKYADIFDFDVVNLAPPYHPDRFIEAIKAAGAAGYDVIILDGISPAWSGAGGILEIVDREAQRMKGNSYAAWGKGTPIHNTLIEAIVSAPIHVICTMRSKQEYVLVERNGKSTPQKMGMSPVQRGDIEYEFDVYLDMDIENNAVVGKTRCPALQGAVIPRPGAQLAAVLSEWLAGAPPQPRGAEPQAALPAATAGNAGRPANGAGNGKKSAPANLEAFSIMYASQSDFFADAAAVRLAWRGIVGDDHRYDSTLARQYWGDLNQYVAGQMAGDDLTEIKQGGAAVAAP